MTIYVTGYAVEPGRLHREQLVDDGRRRSQPRAVRPPVAVIRDHKVEAATANSFRRSICTCYDLLLRGDKAHDATLQNGDVLNIEPVGPEFGGGRQRERAEAIFESQARRDPSTTSCDTPAVYNSAWPTTAG